MTKLPRLRVMAEGRRSASFSRRASASRFPKLLGMAPNALRRLRRLVVVIVGTGSVGMRIACELARLGIAELILIDPKSFKTASLATHPIPPSWVGKSKARSVARLCRRLCASLRVWFFEGPVELLSLADLVKADLIILATDNLSVEIVVAQLSLSLGKPLLQASVHGETLVAQTRFFPNRNIEEACPVCSFGAQEWEAVAREVVFSCEGTAPSRARRRFVGPATMSVGALCSLAADLAVLRWLRWVLDLNVASLEGLHEYCGYTGRAVSSRLHRNLDCRCDHIRMETFWTRRPLGRCSLRDLAGLAGNMLEPGAAWEVSQYRWVDAVACRCDSSCPLGLFVPVTSSHAGRCPSCRSSRRLLPFFTHRSVSFRQLARISDRPLASLGAPEARAVVLRQGARTLLFLQSEPRRRTLTRLSSRS